MNGPHEVRTMRPILIILAAYSLLAVAVLPVAETAASGSKSDTNIQEIDARFALLIGINEYTDPNIRDLRGTENDVVLMRKLLTDPEVGFQFKPADIKELISSKTGSTQMLPTRANIEKAFREHLIKNAKEFREKNPTGEGATILFYYSGHGSFVDDQTSIAEGKDEPDGRDETIVPMDSDKENGVRDITDDEMNKWFNELRQFTTNITFVFDSCHSGTVTRGTGSRSIERVSSKNGPATRGADSLNETMDASESYVTISGSLPNEKSVEDYLRIMPKAGDPVPDDKAPVKMQWNGYLTYNLVQTLQQNRGMTYRELMQLVSAAVTKQNPDQTPQVEGDVDRAFLGSKESRNKRSIAIRKIEPETVNEGGKTVTNSILTIEAGRIVGALPGGSVGIYGEKALQLTGDADRIATGRIFESGNYTSKVRVLGKAIAQRSKIVLANPFFTDEKRKVAIDMSGGGEGLEMRNRLKSLLGRSDYVTPIEKASVSFDGTKDWSVAVKRGSFLEFKEGRTKSPKSRDSKFPNDNEEVYYLASPNGNPLYNFYVAASEQNGERQITEALEKHTKVENLLALNNSAAEALINEGLKVKLVRLKSCRNAETEDEPARIEDHTEAELKRLEAEKIPIVPGNCYYFEISNNTSRDFYMYLYNIGTDGAIQVVYAPTADGDILRKGRMFSTRNEGVLRATEHGKETIKLIATVRRFDARLLTQPAIASRTVRGSDSALEALFAQASTNRRGERINVPFSGWGTTKIDFEIVEKP